MIKGLRKQDHIGIVVPDLRQALDFFQTFFGATIIGTARQFKSDHDDWMKRRLNVHPRAVIEELALVRLFDHTVLELFQYRSPDQQQVLLKNSDWGAFHLAFTVDDIEESIAFLKTHQINIYDTYTYNDPKLDNIDGQMEGVKWVYFESPWGMSIELVEQPQVAE